MKKGLFTLLALCAFTAVHATYYMHETFSQEQGALTAAKFDAANLKDWMYNSGRGGDLIPATMKVVEGNLTYSGYATKQVGNRLVLGTNADANSMVAFRNFTASDAFIKSGSVFVSAIIRIDSLRTPVSTIDNSAHSNGGYILGMGLNTLQQFARLYTKTVVDGDNNPTGFLFGVGKFNEGISDVKFGESVYEAGKDYLVVLEYTFISDAQGATDADFNDIVSLYVNPTAVQSETPTVFTLNTDKADIAGISMITLTEGKAQQGRIYIDELKVATDWASLFNETIEPAKEPQISITPFPNIFEESILKVGDTYTATITVTGEDIESDSVTLTSNHPDEVTFSKSTFTPAELAAGVEVTITAVPAEPTFYGELNLLFTCGDKEKKFSIDWVVVAETKCATIADLAAAYKLGDGEGSLMLNFTGEAIVTYAFTFGRAWQQSVCVILEDESGACVIDRGYNFFDYNTEEDLLAIGNKVTGLELTDGPKFLQANESAQQTGFKVLSKGNQPHPKTISLFDIGEHMFELVSIEESITFLPKAGVTTFDPAKEVTDNNGWGKAVVVIASAGEDLIFDASITTATEEVWTDESDEPELVYVCDLMNTTIPTESVTLSGIVWNFGELRLRGQQDIKSGATAVENIMTETAAKKEIRDNQLLIRKGDMLFNILGTEIR